LIVARGWIALPRELSSHATVGPSRAPDDGARRETQPFSILSSRVRVRPQERTMSATLSSPARTVGRLTTAMRAARSRSAERVLRLARRVDGRIVEDRLLDRRGEVSIGPTLDATFVTPDAPRTVRVLRSNGERRVLELHAGMIGRVVGARGMIDVADAIHRGVASIDLDDDARGRIELFGVSLLFQVVEAPPPKTRAQLPLSVRAGQSVDWKFATLAAFSFLAHFAFAAAVDGDWFDPSIDDDAETASLIETARERPPVPLEQPQDPTIDSTAPASTSPTTKPTSNGSNVASNGKPSNGNGKPGPSSSFSSTASQLSSELDAMQFQTISVFDKSAPATSIVLKPGTNVADVQLDEIAKKKGAAVLSDGTLKATDGSNGPITGPIGPDCIACIAAPPGPKPAPKPTTIPDGPTPVPVPDPIPGPTIGGVPDADAVIAKNRWRFAACFRKVVAESNDPGGTVKVLVSVGEGGEVISASPQSTSASPALTQCLVSSFYPMKFKAPDGGTAQFSVPIVLHQK
jgi:hypothetical protein